MRRRIERFLQDHGGGRPANFGRGLRPALGFALGSDDAPADCRLAASWPSATTSRRPAPTAASATSSPTAGDYYLEIRDIRFQGGGGHRYRLRVGDFPLPSVPYPLAAQKGTSAPACKLPGKSVELPAPLTVTVPADVPGNRLNVAAGYGRARDRRGSRCWPATRPSNSNKSPTTRPTRALRSNCPARSRGVSRPRGDRDFYQFEAKKGERSVFTGQTRSLGSPSDLFMRLYNADGGVLAEAEDTGPEEGMLNYTFPADGIYRLHVEDTNHRGGPDDVYRIAGRAVSARLHAGGRGRKSRRSAKRRVRRESHRRAARLQRPDHAVGRRRRRRLRVAPTTSFPKASPRRR